MKAKEYLAALKKLGLTPSGQATAAALGMAVRRCQRIAAGTNDVPPPVALLLDMYLKHGLPKWVDKVAENARKAMQKGARADD